MAQTVDFSNVNWSSQPAVLHRRHGMNLSLSENNTVAEKVEKWNWRDGVVMTAEPVPVCTMFQVTVLKKVKTRSEGLVSVLPCGLFLHVGECRTCIHIVGRKREMLNKSVYGTACWP